MNEAKQPLNLVFFKRRVKLLVVCIFIGVLIITLLAIFAFNGALSLESVLALALVFIIIFMVLQFAIVYIFVKSAKNR